ncbi:MAG: helix-turn-helix domain-containing protein [Actinomycetota bacterium]
MHRDAELLSSANGSDQWLIVCSDQNLRMNYWFEVRDAEQESVPVRAIDRDTAPASGDARYRWSTAADFIDEIAGFAADGEWTVGADGGWGLTEPDTPWARWRPGSRSRAPLRGWAIPLIALSSPRRRARSNGAWTEIRLSTASDAPYPQGVPPSLPAPRSTCPIALTTDLVGDRWTLLIVRDLALKGKRHFSELAADEGIATNVLSDRLALLQAADIVTASADPDDGRRKVYALTERGLDLIPVLVAMARWGAAHAPDAVASDAYFELADALAATRTTVSPR